MSGFRLITILIDSPMEPRWTGMCGALAIRPPWASKTAQEKSSRSLMLTEWAVACRRTPICSATDMNKLLKISSITGSARVVASDRARRGALQEQVTAVGHDRLPAGLDHGGGEVLGDDGRAVDGLPVLEGGAREQVYVGPGAVGKHADALRLGVLYFGRTGRGVSSQVFLRAGHFDRDGFGDDRLVGHQEGEPAGVLGLERGGHLRQ